MTTQDPERRRSRRRPVPAAAEVHAAGLTVDWAMVLCVVAMVVNGLTIVAVSRLPG